MTAPTPRVVHLTTASYATLKIVMTWCDNPIASGTGFVVRHNGDAYLVTNRHNLDGLDAAGRPRSSRGVTPDSVTIIHNGTNLGTWVRTSEPILDGNGQPLWLQHPIFGSIVDVVALKLGTLDGVTVYPFNINEPSDPRQRLRLVISQDVSIVGFPFGMTGGLSLALWIRGTIASEPEVDFQGLPLFLVDSRTRRGQSGSPVIFFSANGMVPIQGGLAMGTRPREVLLGVYSGRVNEESDLGLVWKSRVISEILEGGVRGVIASAALPIKIDDDDDVKNNCPGLSGEA